MNNNIRTLRGHLTDTNVHRIVVDDGRPNNGYKVLGFRVWPEGGGAEGVFATIGTQYDMLPGARADDNRQFGWAGSTWSSTGTPTTGAFSVIDPDHVIIADMYIQSTTANIDPTNYLIVVEPMILSDDEAILQLIKERSQDDVR